MPQTTSQKYKTYQIRYNDETRTVQVDAHSTRTYACQKAFGYYQPNMVITEPTAKRSLISWFLFK